MDKVFVEVKVVNINLEHGNLGLAMALLFQQIVQLGGQQFLFPFHKCIHHTTN
jgi:hypothetical protein